MKTKAIAVLDVGKTNKKNLIFDRNLHILEKKHKPFGELDDDKGQRLEQPEAVLEWFLTELSHYSQQYEIEVISITTHGAMGICVDEHGRITCPPIAYTNEPGPVFCDSFYDAFGDRIALQSRTATAEIGQMINFGKMAYYWTQRYPAEIKNTKHILLYPQYFGYKMTGKAAAETTMLGCHTYLYDHKNNAYSDIVQKLGLAEKLPKPIKKSWKILGNITPDIARRCGLSNDCLVTLGVHDSNATLLVYLLNQRGDYVLNSTGTWCVAMKPASDVVFKREELGKTVYYNQDVFGHPVKTSIFMAGQEYETYTELFTKIHIRKDLPPLKRNLYQSLYNSCRTFVLPSVVKGAGLFPNSQPRLVHGDHRISLEELESSSQSIKGLPDYELSMTALVSSLVIQTSRALDFSGYQDGGDIFVEGGFKENQPYLELLAACYPKSHVYKTSIDEATATGAAILGLAAVEGKRPDELKIDFSIDKQLIERPGDLFLESYKSEFYRYVNETTS